MNALRDAALQSKAWPYEEARKLLKRYPDGKPNSSPILFETGYGPSGLPHLGTFQEVARTQMVRHAFAELSDYPTRLIAFSDDMDGMRKVAENLPNRDMLAEHLGKPLCHVPNPFDTDHESFAAHNNAMLKTFLDRYGFDYEFLASSDCYGSGRFDDTLRLVLSRYDEIMDVMLPTLGEKRRATYSPVLPISPASGKVLQVPVDVINPEAGMVQFVDPATDEAIKHCIFGGQAKLQWKVDWALRWVALGVDYEMAGKDLIDSVMQSSKIARVLGARPPEGFNYELFLDENGQKISKTRGNGVTIDEWLTYAPEESLSFYIYRDPKRAKQLSFGVIPRAVDGASCACRPSAAAAHANQLCLAAQPGQRCQHGRQGSDLGFCSALCAGRFPGKPSGARCPDRPCARLFPGFCGRNAEPACTGHARSGGTARFRPGAGGHG